MSAWDELRMLAIYLSGLVTGAVAWDLLTGGRW